MMQLLIRTLTLAVLFLVSAFDSTAQPAAPTTVTFGSRLAEVGDQVEQRLTMEMRLATSIRQGNELIERNQMAMQSDQHRMVTTSAVAEGRATSVVVHYLSAARRTGQSSGTPPSDVNLSESPAVPEPVAGKSYRCRRDRGEDGPLIVTDAAGNVPPAEELAIVTQNMDMVGRGNPLAEFLAGRTLALGETVRLPQQAADRLFHLGDRFGEVARFDLTLRETRDEDGQLCAVFAARVDAVSNDSSQMRLIVEGPLVVLVQDCRAVRTELTGPLAISETRGSYSTASQLIGTGRLKMRVASSYGASTQR